MISKKLPKELSDLLTRVKASGLTDDQIHDRAQLPSGWLSGARRNRYGPHAKSWVKLRGFLDRLGEGGDGIAPLPPLVVQPQPVEPAPTLIVADESGKTPIGKAIMQAKTFRRLGALVTLIAATVADDKNFDLKVADTLERLIKARTNILKQERAEAAVAKVRALEILTSDEVRLIEEHRAKLAGPPLEPGDYPPPPTDSAASPDAPVLDACGQAPCPRCGKVLTNEGRVCRVCEP